MKPITLARLSPAMLLVAMATAPAAAQEYDVYIIEALSEFGIPEAYLTGVNAAGVAVGRMTYTTQDSNGNYHTTYHGYRWTVADGPVVDLERSTYTSINNRGDILAGSEIMFADGHSGSMRAVPGDRSIDGNAINEAGFVAGTSTYRYYSGCRYARRAVFWSEATGTVNLEAFVPSAEIGSDINNASEIVGATSYSGSCGDFEAYLYRVDSNEWIDLHRMLTGGGPGITEAVAINDLGQVAGQGWNGSFSAAWLWDPAGGFTFLPPLKNGDRDRVRPYDVSLDGVIIGSAATSGWSEPRAFIWSDADGIRDLNDLVVLPPNFILDRAIAINDSGMIVGDGHWGPNWGTGVAFVLVPRGAQCPADFDGNGTLDIRDFFAFQSAYAQGDSRADLDGNGTLDIRDFFAFQAAFAEGC